MVEMASEKWDDPLASNITHAGIAAIYIACL